jgi:raffinose/stachyose/melibiose transport system substrate-binding protein
MIKKLLVLALCVALVFSLFAGCTKSGDGDKDTKDTGSKDAVKITMLNSKGEIQEAFENGAKTYTDTNDKNVTLEVIAAPQGTSPFEKITSLYAANEAPVLQLLDRPDVVTLKDKYVDLSNEKWINDLIPNALDNIKVDGKVLSFPAAVEGYGMIYNKKVVGKDFDPASVSTIDGLEKVLKGLGDKSLEIPSMDWSLGNHFFALVYALQGKTYPDVEKFLDNLKAGKEDLTKNAAFNGVLDSFDVMKKYNVAKNDPLSTTYDTGVAKVAKGEIGMWFMGNWATTQITENAGDNDGFAFAPVPVSNNTADYGNTEIAAGISKFVGVDSTQNSKEQQQAAKDFLNWLVYEDAGQKLMVTDAKIVPAFKNITIEPATPLEKSIQKYIADGKALLFMNILPSDHWKELGASMQKYLSGKIDRAGLAKEIEAYWQKQK